MTTKNNVLKELRTIFKALNLEASFLNSSSLVLNVQGLRIIVSVDSNFPDSFKVKFFEVSGVEFLFQSRSGADLFLIMRRNGCFNKTLIYGLRVNRV